MKNGLAGSLAKLFINSKLTPLLMVAFIIIGVYSSLLIPREEEPQIEVPIADIFFQYRGASPSQMESKVVAPMEKLLSNIPGVEYVYSTSMPGQAILIVQFFVGDDIERSQVKLYNEIMKHMDQMPKGVSMPLIKTRAIDDVPILTVNLWSDSYSDFQLKRIAQELNNEIEKVSDVSQTNIIGGRAREIRIIADAERMSSFKVDIMSISKAVNDANMQSASGSINKMNTEFLVKTGNFLSSLSDVENLIVAIRDNTPVYLKQVAEIVDGPQLSDQYVSFAYGKAHELKSKYTSEYPAVSISVAKRKGADAMKINETIINKIESVKSQLIPSEVHVEISRNYGESASKKVSELLLHLLGAILAVSFVVVLAMGWRGGLVVFLSVPITFALTMFSYYFMDYTLNRITLFALVFVTGIVVDDSIIIAENMHRHFKLKKMSFKDAAIYSINEVGNPTILATFTVIAAVLPMIFVSGLMGPYMSPMPIGASIAMIFSLLVALSITPYLAFRLLKKIDTKIEKVFVLETTSIYKIYYKILNPLLESRKKRNIFILGVSTLLLASFGLIYFKMVAVKMLPFDNKNELQILIDMPEGSSLEKTFALSKELSYYLSTQDNILSYQSYVGTAAPINFNGLLRHYDLRRKSNLADIQVNLTDKDDREIQSHGIAKLLRPGLKNIAKAFNANVKVVEVPPGPPVVSTIVAEIYGPDKEVKIDIAKQLMDVFNNTPDVVDVDIMLEDDQIEYNYIVDKQKAMMMGVSTSQIVNALAVSFGGSNISQLYHPNENQELNINLRLNKNQRSSLSDVNNIKLMSQFGELVSVASFVSLKKNIVDKSIYRKNQKRVLYVTADLAGELESPVYAILNISDKLKDIRIPENYSLKEEFTKPVVDETNYTIKWDGEWQITYEVFRDLGAAFAVVLLIIYMLIIGWFQNFKLPFVMMVSIPLSLVGILIGHWLMGAYFTATSMIGLIALAGIMVRNAILLVDFINISLEEGMPIKEAVIKAGAVRTTPILLTAGTVVIGAVVILFDPIFQGLAISLMGGSIASTFLTLIIVPLIYYITEKHKYKDN